MNTFTGNRLELYWSPADVVAMSYDEIVTLQRALDTAITAAMRRGLFNEVVVKDCLDGSHSVILLRYPFSTHAHARAAASSNACCAAPSLSSAICCVVVQRP